MNGYLFLCLYNAIRTVLLGTLPPTPSTTPFTFSELLPRIMQPAPRPCYHQYERPIPEITIFNPDLFKGHLTYPFCVCEIWWPSERPNQMVLKQGVVGDSWETQDAAKCLPERDSVRCTTFEEDKTCSQIVWLGSTENRPSTVNAWAVLKCTAGSSVKQSDQPRYPVKIYAIDDFDIGKRCEKPKLMKMLNYKLEIYRAKSQFYWQIAIFDARIIEGICDPRMDGEGAAVKVYYKCLNSVPDLTDETLHVKPELSKRIGDVGPLLNFEDKARPLCYKQVGESALFVQGATHIPTVENPLCVCEDEEGIQKTSDASKCLPFEAKDCGVDDPAKPIEIRKSYIATMEDGTCYSLLSSKNVQHRFRCNAEREPKTGPKPALWNTQYYPAFVPRIDSVRLVFFMFDYDGQGNIVNRGNTFTDDKHEKICDLEDAKQGKEAWKQYIQNRVVYKRYNSDVYLRLPVNPLHFIENFCPKLFDDELRQNSFEGYLNDPVTIAEINVEINATCVPMEPVVEPRVI